jgi:hypothetical protein
LTGKIGGISGRGFFGGITAAAGFFGMPSMMRPSAGKLKEVVGIHGFMPEGGF